MTIFNSYVSLPEGNHDQPNIGICASSPMLIKKFCMGYPPKFGPLGHGKTHMVIPWTQRKSQRDSNQLDSLDFESYPEISPMKTNVFLLQC